MDLRLLPLTIGLWLATAGSLIIGSSNNWYLIFIWALAIFFISFALVKRKLLNSWDLTSAKFFILGLLAGLAIATLRMQPLISGPIKTAAQDHAVVTVTGDLTEDVRRSKVTGGLDLVTRDFGVFKLQTSTVKYRGNTYRVRVPIRIYISGQNLEKVLYLPPGTRLRITGKFKPGDSIRSDAAALTATAEIQIVNPPPNYQFLASSFRFGLHKVLKNTNHEVAGLVPGLALGDTSTLDQTLALDMKSAGLTHLTAVSGSNVTLLIALVISLGHRFKFRKRTNYLVSLVALGAFVVIVRPQPSVLRASIMGVIMVLALISKSPKSPLPALTGCTIFLILLDPWLSISFGFALSVFATAGLLLWAKPLLLSMDRLLPKRIPEWLVTGLVVTVSAQIAVFPILIGLGSPASLSSLPANLISVPLAGPTMVFGILSAVAAQIWLPIGQLLIYGATIPAQGIVFAAHFFAQQTWLTIPWPQGAGGIFLALLAIVAGVQMKQSWPTASENQKTIALTTCIVLLAALWLKPLSQFKNWVPSNWQIVSCDVGQGDATVIQVSKHQAIVVDVGGDPDLINKCLTQLQIKKIPLLLLTHFHADHVVGLPGALAGREVGEIRISPLADPPLTTKFVYKVLVEYKKSATVLAFPDYLKIGEVELFCIWPKAKPDESSNTPNNASVSVVIKSGQVSLLLPGDIEEPAQEAILKLVGDLHSNIVKVPHHGSRNQSTNFARRVNADIAIVSVGKNNEYGHPAPETVFLYESTGARVIRTDQHGSVVISSDGNRLKLTAEK